MSQINRSVLVLDDDNVFRAMVATILISKGFEVIETGSPQEADAVLRTGNPALAIVDYRLPQMDGVSWISKILQAGRKFPIVFLSGITCDAKTLNWLRNIHRVALILSKPISPESFIQQIESLLPASLSGNSSREETESEITSFASAQFTAPESEKLLATSNSQSLRTLTDTGRGSKLADLKTAYGQELTLFWQALSDLVTIAHDFPSDCAKRDDAIDLAHKIRGTAGSVGFNTVGDAAGKIEDLLCGDEETEVGGHEVNWTEILRTLASGWACVEAINEGLGSSSESIVATGSRPYAFSQN